MTLSVPGALPAFAPPPGFEGRPDATGALRSVSTDRCALMTSIGSPPDLSALPGRGSVAGLKVGFRVLAIQCRHDGRPVGSDVSGPDRQDHVAVACSVHHGVHGFTG